MVTFPSYVSTWPNSHSIRCVTGVNLHLLSEALRSEVTGSQLTADLGPEPRSDHKSAGGSTVVRRPPYEAGAYGHD